MGEVLTNHRKPEGVGSLSKPIIQVLNISRFPPESCEIRIYSQSSG